MFMTLYRKVSQLIPLFTGALLIFGAATTLAESGTKVSKTNVPPAPAAAVGYNTLAFGPSVGIGTNWFLFSFYGLHGGPAIPNSDGSVLLPGNIAGSQYGISTAAQIKPGKEWTGIAFGGGAYFVATFSFTGGFQPGRTTWPAWWANPIEMMAPNGVTHATQWPGQAANYGNWIEPDFFEYNNGAPNKYGDTVHNWYGVVGRGDDVNPNFPSITVPAGFDWAKAHKYGFLWVPATATTKGYATSYLDDVQVGGTAVWSEYNPTNPPPPVDGATAYSILDKYHLALILSSGTNNPMTVQSVEVWQANTNHNSINGNNDYRGS
ncbi:MAG TPA: hypothetical protein VGO57_03215 [Verrucomicrobiae bacterium]|jgi:hypothetical protein